ncbi:hypothetical protein P9112_013916 [Eukaryota sp. TZLM1-RC]
MVNTEMTYAPETAALHSEGHDTCTHAHVTPIFATSTYLFDSPEHGGDLFAGKQSGHIYSRIANPTVEAAERTLAAIEKDASGALLFGSGMAAVHAALMYRLNAGDHIVAGRTLYGCTHKYIASLTRWNIDVTFVNSSNTEEVRNAMKPNTRIVYIETPANPTNSITDIAAVAEIAHQQDCILVCDNTFQSPLTQSPLALGADIGLYSTTKNLNGHGTSVGGALTIKDASVLGEIQGFRVLTGGNTSPFDAFLVLQGIKTLDLRIRKMVENGAEVARWLETHDDVEVVHHPALPSHPQHELAMKQSNGMLPSCFSFETKHGFEFAKNVLRNVKLISLAVSLGTIDTLIQHPASMTHACVPPKDREESGITDTLIRISVGVENVQDLIKDLDQAFKAAKASM